MLISHKHRFIFIHVYKNAGTSITHALMPFAAYRWQKKAHSILKRFGVSYLDPRRYDKHIKAKELISQIGKRRFESYFTFGIVRNPWDWQVSLYNYMLKDKRHFQHELVKSFCTFDEYIEWRCTEAVRYQKDFLFSSENEPLVNFIGKYERIDDEFMEICSRIGISCQLPKLNVTKIKPYQGYYNKVTIELIRKTFEPDIRLLKYDFE